MNRISFVILAAGKSRRMKSTKSKVLHNINERPIINYVNDIAENNQSSGIYYICSNEVQDYINNNFPKTKTIIQKQRLGTAHAVECARKFVSKKNNDIIVLFGDVPFVKNSTIKKLIKHKHKKRVIGAIVTFLTNNPFGYGRVVTKNGYVKDVIEEKDTNNDQKKIKICNSGILICDAKYLFKTLNKISNKNNQKERFLTDICKIAYLENKPFSYINCDEIEVLGVNSPNQLIDLEQKYQNNKKNKLIKNGVILKNPESIYIGHGVKIGRDVIVEQNTIIKNNVTINNSCNIRSGSYLEGCKIGKKCSIGPYARIRPNSKLSDYVKIGNFVEIKNSNIGKFSAVSHLSYIGDSILGKNVNIGAGTITCNYDGKKKNKTIIKDNVFVGSNCSLIAPIKISSNSVIGAGSVVSRDVPESFLAIERSKLILKKIKNTKKNSKKY